MLITLKIITYMLELTKWLSGVFGPLITINIVNKNNNSTTVINSGEINKPPDK